MTSSFLCQIFVLFIAGVTEILYSKAHTVPILKRSSTDSTFMEIDHQRATVNVAFDDENKSVASIQVDVVTDPTAIKNVTETNQNTAAVNSNSESNNVDEVTSQEPIKHDKEQNGTDAAETTSSSKIKCDVRFQSDPLETTTSNLDVAEQEGQCAISDTGKKTTFDAERTQLTTGDTGNDCNIDTKTLIRTTTAPVDTNKSVLVAESEKHIKDTEVNSCPGADPNNDDNCKQKNAIDDITISENNNEKVDSSCDRDKVINENPSENNEVAENPSGEDNQITIKCSGEKKIVVENSDNNDMNDESTSDENNSVNEMISENDEKSENSSCRMNNELVRNYNFCKNNENIAIFSPDNLTGDNTSAENLDENSSCENNNIVDNSSCNNNESIENCSGEQNIIDDNASSENNSSDKNSSRENNEIVENSALNEAFQGERE